MSSAIVRAQEFTHGIHDDRRLVPRDVMPCPRHPPYDGVRSPSAPPGEFLDPDGRDRVRQTIADFVLTLGFGRGQLCATGLVCTMVSPLRRLLLLRLPVVDAEGVHVAHAARRRIVAVA